MPILPDLGLSAALDQMYEQWIKGQSQFNMGSICIGDA